MESGIQRLRDMDNESAASTGNRQDKDSEMGLKEERNENKRLERKPKQSYQSCRKNSRKVAYRK